MKNLGKLLTILILLTTTVFATVTAKVEPRNIYEGESATYVLTVTGGKIKKPQINDICGNDITASSSQTSIESINGSYKKSYTLSYQFTPKKECTIPAVKLEIDSKIETSNSVNVVLKPRGQDFKADFILSFSTPKHELYIGEPFDLTLLLKQRKGAEAVDSKFIAPVFKGFWMKSEDAAKRVNEGDFIVTKVVYHLAAQREGTLHIEPASLKIAQRTGVNNWGTFMPQVKWRTYYSNSLDIVAKPLPNNAKIVGDLTLNASVDKKVVNPNEPVKVNVTVSGKGNLEDIENFKPYVKDVNIFDEKIVVKNDLLMQKLVFVSDRDFIIPAFTLVYFDVKSGKVKKLTTKAIAIKVNGNVPKDKLEIKREKPVVVRAPEEEHTTSKVVVENNYVFFIVSFACGVIIGVLLMIFLQRKASPKSKKVDIKDEKILLIKLLPFKDIDIDVFKIVEILEENIYSKTKQPIDKRLLKEILNKYDIS